MKYVINSETLLGIADLIREKEQSAAPVPVTAFESRLRAIIDSRPEVPDEPTEEPLYRIGLLSDVHIQYDTDQDGNGKTDWEDACLWYQHLGVDAICIAGDLTRNGYESDLIEWKTARDSARGTIPVYSSSGNHESKQSTSLQVTNPSAILPYLDSDATSSGNPYYSKVINGDIFAFMPVFEGNVQSSSNTFSLAALTWLENLLEEHRNERVFLFQHMIPNPTLTGNFGSANGIYSVYPIGTSKSDTKKFLDMMAHYKNVIWFSGHSHIKWEFETEYPGLNYARYNGDGAKMVHLSSTTVPRDITDGSKTDIYAEGEAAVMEVYADGVVVKGYDLIRKSYISEFNLSLDTAPIIIPEKENDAPAPVVLTSISATKTVKSYNVGETVKTSDIVVTGHYSDGATATLTGWTASAIDTSTAGTQVMTITYQDKTATIDIVINAVVVPDEPTHQDINVPITWTSGDLNYTTGEIAASSSYAYSQDIPHSSGNSYTIKSNVKVSSYPKIRVVEFDSNRNIVGYSNDVVSASYNMEGTYSPENSNTAFIVLRLQAKSGMADISADGGVVVTRHT